MSDTIVNEAPEQAQSTESNNEAPEASAVTPAQVEKRKYKLKVSGEEKELELSDEEITQRLAKAEGAELKFQEASQIRKQAEQFVEALKNDPIGVLSHPDLGVDLRTIAENYLAEQLAKEMMDPKDRELEELKRFKEEQEAQEAQELQRQEEAKQAELQNQALNAVSQKITEVLKSESLPANPRTVARVAYHMHNAIKHGVALDINKVVEKVRGEYQNDVSFLFKDASPETVVQMLGDDIVKKVRAYDQARFKPKQAAQVVKPVKASTPQKKKNLSQWSKSLRKTNGL